MKIPAFMAAMLVVSFALPGRAEDLQARTAKLYLEVLMTGDVARADSLATVPYWLDGTPVRSLDGLHALHRKILKDKGKRRMPVFMLDTLAGSPLDSTFPRHRTIRFFTGKKTLLTVYVTADDSPKVVGLVD